MIGCPDAFCFSEKGSVYAPVNFNKSPEPNLFPASSLKEEAGIYSVLITPCAKPSIAATKSNRNKR
jgi:hypothetical protein